MTSAPRRRITRLAAPCVLALGAVAGSGCANPCYAPAQPVCPPVAAAAPATVRYGEICQTPAAGSSSVAQSTPSRAATMADAPRPRVVVSEPSNRLAGRAGWRRVDPEAIATRVEGAVDEDVVRR
jgi:hypothetical protein